MKITIAFFLLSIGLTAISFLSANLSAQETDNATGLIVADGWQAVQENCTECHSPLLITQNSGSKTVWESRIRWMQETQGLQQLDEPVEETILAYLSSTYGQKESGRRASLPSSLMPENPYESID